MKHRKRTESIIGIAMVAIVAIFALFLVLSYGGKTRWRAPPDYTVKAQFRNVGELKVQAPVKLAGVCIGRVKQITLNPASLVAEVELSIQAKYDRIPVDASLAIETAGFLGESYITFKLPAWIDDSVPKQYLKESDTITCVRDVLSLEDLVAEAMRLGLGNLRPE